ncbi:MAG: polyprenyl diphosphate synthase [Desulfobacterota bacterium]|nr:polyprenyl diphosphate synthase [Thermodesulfobacteriota bacterium]MDW8001083.1 polyprenyl diphosphate synthase [Deltaproteobacteria bacterium]
MSLVLKPIYYLYEKFLERQVLKGIIPAHVALILDGNRRYAKEMGFSDVSMGHKLGAQKVDELLIWCAELNIKVVTIWVLSTDNIYREPEELEKLLFIIESKLYDLSKNPMVKRYGYRIKILGNTSILPVRLQEVVRIVEKSTKDNKDRILNIALGYGGREEIIEAVKKAILSKKTQNIEKIIEGLTTEDVGKYLYTYGIPDPDLIIRTSGEIRLSGFLLWQSAYSEFYFCDALWPAFRKIDFLRAIRSYQHRKRRFGR